MPDKGSTHGAHLKPGSQSSCESRGCEPTSGMHSLTHAPLPSPKKASHAMVHGRGVGSVNSSVGMHS